MKYVGRIQSLAGVNYKVVIISNNDDTETTNITLSGNEPITIESDSDDLFSPIKSRSCTINMVSEDYYFDMYSSTAQGTSVTVTNDDNNQVVFRGYLTPNIYDQEFNYINEISLEAIEALSTLEYYKYEFNTPLIVTMYSILKNILYTKCGYNKLYFHRDLKLSSTDTSYLLNQLYLHEMNFADDDGKWRKINGVLSYDGEKWTLKELLEEICKYLNVSCCVYNDNIYFVNYSALKNNINEWDVYNFTNDTTSRTTISDTQNVTLDSYKDDGNSVSLSDTYNKIIVECDTYPIETLLTNIFDSDLTQIAPTDDDPNPYYYTDEIEVTKVETKKSGFLFIHTSTTITPGIYYNYYIFYNSDIVDYFVYQLTNSGYIYRSTNDGPPVQWEVGGGIIRNASEKREAKINNSINWTGVLVLANGFDQAVDNSTQQGIITNNPAKMIEWAPTQSNIFYSDGQSYIVISGSVYFGNKIYEQLECSPFNDSDWFKKPNGPIIYTLQYGGIYEQDPIMSQIIPESTYTQRIGFNCLRMKIEIGNKCYNRDYGWHTPTGDMTHDIEEIPIGDHEYSWYAWNDITNTVCWKDELDGIKGYAIPISPEDGLNGQLKITFYNPYVPYGWTIGRRKPISGDYEYETAVIPKYILVKDFEVTFANSVYKPIGSKKDEDITYENVINDTYVQDFDAIGLKINTQVPNEKFWYSSVIQGGNTYNQSLYSTALGKSQLQEYNIIEQQYNHYYTPKKIYDMITENNLTPYSVLTYPLLDNTKFVINKQVINLSNDTSEINLIEV